MSTTKTKLGPLDTIDRMALAGLAVPRGAAKAARSYQGLSLLGARLQPPGDCQGWVVVS
jgi:hypothetical protein